MEITEVRVFVKNSKEGKLKAYVTITLDSCFIVRDLKVIEGKKGLFVAMPSRKLRYPCSKCGQLNAIGSKFCNGCGKSIEPLPQKDGVHAGSHYERESRQDTYKDIAHPINLETRDAIQKKVLEVYEKEKAGTGQVQT